MTNRILKPPTEEIYFDIIKKHDIYLIILIFIIALFIRISYLVSYYHTPYWDVLILDTARHWEIASRIANGFNQSSYAYFRAPFYMWLLSLFVKLDHGLWLIRIFQAILGASTAALTARLGYYYLSRPFAIASGIFMAFFWTSIYFDGEILITSLITFMCILTLSMVIKADTIQKDQPNYHSVLYWFIAGLLSGLSAITRPNIMVFIILVPAILAIREIYRIKRVQNELEKYTKVKQSVIHISLFLIGTVLIIFPVTLRNFVIAEDFVLISSQGGINFWIGNHTNADGRTSVNPLPFQEVSSSFKLSRYNHPWLNDSVWASSAYVAEKEMRIRAKESQISRYWYKKSLSWIKNNPFDATVLWLKKLLYVFQRKEISSNRNLITHNESHVILKVLSYFHFGFISPLILLGMICAIRRFGIWNWPLIFFWAYVITLVMFFCK